MNEHKKMNHGELSSSNFDAMKSFLRKVFGWSFQNFSPEYAVSSDAGLGGGFLKLIVPMSVLPLIVSGCAPVQETAPEEECFDSNVNLVAVGDEQYISPIPETPAIDAIMEPYLTASGAPAGCAVGAVVNNEVHFLKGYGEADRETNTPS